MSDDMAKLDCRPLTQKYVEYNYLVTQLIIAIRQGYKNINNKRTWVNNSETTHIRSGLSNVAHKDSNFNL